MKKCAVTCTSPSELFSPHSGMFASEWAVARRFTTLWFMCKLERVVCCLLGVSPHSGMFASEWAVARRFTMLWFMCELERVVYSGFLHTQVCLHLSELFLRDSPRFGLCVNLSELFAQGFSTLRYVCI